MGKREDYEAKTEKLIAPIIAANHVELFDVDYVKEGQDWYLRVYICLLYTSPSPRDRQKSRMPSSA